MRAEVVTHLSCVVRLDWWRWRWWGAQGCIRGLWAVNTNGAVQSDCVKEEALLFLQGVEERWVCLLLRKHLFGSKTC